MSYTTTDNDNFTCIETDESFTIQPKAINNKGFLVSVTFTKNQSEHDESMGAIREFFVREVL